MSEFEPQYCKERVELELTYSKFLHQIDSIWTCGPLPAVVVPHVVGLETMSFGLARLLNTTGTASLKSRAFSRSSNRAHGSYQRTWLFHKEQKRKLKLTNFWYHALLPSDVERLFFLSLLAKWSDPHIFPRLLLNSTLVTTQNLSSCRAPKVQSNVENFCTFCLAFSLRIINSTFW